MEPKKYGPEATPEQIPFVAAAGALEASLDRVFRKLKTCQHLLTAPATSSMLACGTCMGEIRLELESLTAVLGSAPLEFRGGLREKIVEMVSEFRHVGRLMDSACTLHQGWARVLSSYLRGYTRNGAPAALRCHTETLFHG